MTSFADASAGITVNLGDGVPQERGELSVLRSCQMLMAGGSDLAVTVEEIRGQVAVGEHKEAFTLHLLSPILCAIGAGGRFEHTRPRAVNIEFRIREAALEVLLKFYKFSTLNPLHVFAAETEFRLVHHRPTHYAKRVC